MAGGEGMTAGGPPSGTEKSFSDEYLRDFAPLFAHSVKMRWVRDIIEAVASTNAAVLIRGESGVGKEVVARAIHAASARHGQQFVKVNCAALPTELLESELFGHEKGAFTGAYRQKLGKFELAHKGTMFLDEIGDLPRALQAKLLHVLQDFQFSRVGGREMIHVDTCMIAATNRNLEVALASGEFREDLYYRLNVVEIRVPPLRERKEEILALAESFLERFNRQYLRNVELSPETIAAFQQYAWPGNIRELRNVVERAMIVARTPHLSIILPGSTLSTGRRSCKLADVEKEHIKSVLDGVGWRIRGLGGAAERLGLRPTTLETRMAKLGLSRPKPSVGCA
jgi:formate hydrogenlyase transcriptional activator